MIIVYTYTIALVCLAKKLNSCELELKLNPLLNL